MSQSGEGNDMGNPVKEKHHDGDHQKRQNNRRPKGENRNKQNNTSNNVKGEQNATKTD